MNPYRPVLSRKYDKKVEMEGGPGVDSGDDASEDGAEIRLLYGMTADDFSGMNDMLNEGYGVNVRRKAAERKVPGVTPVWALHQRNVYKSVWV